MTKKSKLLLSTIVLLSLQGDIDYEPSKNIEKIMPKEEYVPFDTSRLCFALPQYKNYINTHTKNIKYG